ncbi:sugar ABC transporter substrate-binding protein [Mesorhizobium sp. BAC0120]|uniref:sugar ABC transporter substrate-binding protein n=1 Tax=Mesorhizobium sp. BAC0120 TaxID=3090670 RepID=UPI00298C83B5|nr:sugar ABC transporter substrate-binding protein [Mesorhizobium sp. BAC0120]MDW6021241.1 sugar ABC transporter substrate-binding protein [Mesorhizobium sp. BAC0120]
MQMLHDRRMLVRTTLRTAAALAIASTMFASAQAEPIKSILFVNPLPQFPAWRLIGDCIAKEAKAKNITETESGPTDGTLNTTAMMQQVQQGIANSAGAIITFPATDGFVPLLQQARDAGIMVGTLYGASGTGSGSQVNVGANFATVGEIMVKAIAAREGQQNVGLMIQGPTGAGKAFSEAFEKAAAETPNVKVIATVSTGDDANKSLDQANALLIAHPEINVIASHMGTATQGAVAAIKAKDLQGKVVMVANGAAGGGTEGLQEGTVYQLMMQNLCGAGTQIVDALVKINDGESVPEQLDVGVQMFGKEDVQAFIDKGWQ